MQKLSNRKGLSTVITTLIILVVAVLLAGVVTYYATNVVMTRTTQEEVRIRKPHIWVQEGDNAYAAIMVQNLGGRDVLIDKITLRGVNVPWGGESEVIGTGAVATGTLTYKPIIPGSIVITATVAGVPIVVTDTLTSYPAGTLDGAALGAGPNTINYLTGDWVLTWQAGGDPDGEVTASYSVEGAVYVQFYRVEAGEDVSGDFELKEVAGEVFAQIGTVPVQGDWDPAISDMPLKSSGSMLFFIMNPTNIALHDVGTTISLTIYTSNAQWIVETIVQAAEIN